MALEIVAHRGASADAPENTLSAIQLAWQQNADAAEIDVLLTADGQLVAIHDETTWRTAGVDWTVAERSLAELKTLDVGSWKGPPFVGEHIPTLAEVLEIVPPSKRLFIEVKCGAEAIPELHRVLAASRTPREQTVLISLDFNTIVAAKCAIGDRVAFWVTEQFAHENNGEVTLNPPTRDLVAQAVAAGLDGLDINDLPERPKGDIGLILQAGLRSSVWTVNSLERAKWLRDEGVESITTDIPGKLAALRS